MGASVPHGDILSNQEKWARAGPRRRLRPSAVQDRWTSVPVCVRRQVLRLGGMSTGSGFSLHRAGCSYPARPVWRAAPPPCIGSPRAAQRGPPRQISQRRKPTNVPYWSDQPSRKAMRSGLAFHSLPRPYTRSPIATAVNSN